MKIITSKSDGKAPDLKLAQLEAKKFDGKTPAKQPASNQYEQS